MGGTRFMVQWEEHPSHLATRLGQLLEHQTLVDVTLMCNTHTLRVHRAVLAACSPYFESILQRQLGAHPLIVLKDMQFSVLKSLIEFMYCGETSVTEENLGPLLQAAKFFQVKGLSSMTKEALGLPPSPARPSTVNGETVKRGTKKIGMQTTLVSTANVLNKQMNSTTTVASSGSRGHTSDAGSTKPITSTSSITTDTAQLLLNLSGSEGSTQQQQHQRQILSPGGTGGTPTRQLLQMSSRNVRLSNLRGGPSNIIKPVVERRVQNVVQSVQSIQSVHESQAETPDTPRKRGRPLKKQINVTFQEKVMTDAEIALQKEADASRLALEALKKEMNTGSAASTNELAQQQTEVVYEVADGATTDDISEVVEGNEVTLVGQEVRQAENQSANQSSNQASNQSAAGMSSYMEALKEAGLPTDMPILLDSGDGSYVTVNEEVLMNICNGGVIHYQVAEGNLVQGSDGQVVIHEQQAANAVSAAGGSTPVTVATPVVSAPEVKTQGRRNNRVVTPAGGCGFTTARQIVKASMDKYRQEQAGLRKFVVKEMEAAELILEQSDEAQPVKEEEEELIAEQVTQEEEEEAVEWHESEAQGEAQVEAQVEGESQEQGQEALVGAGQVQALFHTIEGEGGEVYLVAENDGDASHTFTVLGDGSHVLGDGSHGFQLEDGTIVVQEGPPQETELSVEQALEAMMGTGATVGAEDSVAEDGEERTVQVQSSAEELQLVLSPAQDETSAPSMVTKVRTQVAAEGDVASPSKDIPYAVGLLPLKTALEKIHNIQEYQPRKTRGAGQPGEVAVKRKSVSGLDGVVEKRARSDGGSDTEVHEVKEQP